MTRRRRLSLFLLRLGVQCSMVCGVLPYKYNTKLKTLELSNCALAYSVGINVAFVFGLALTFSNVLEYEDKIPDAALRDMMNAIQIVVSTITLVAMLSGYWFRRRYFLHVVNDGLALLSGFFGDRHVENEFFDRYVIQRFIIIMVQMLSNLYTMIGINSQPSAGYLVLTALMFMMQNIFMSSETQYYFGVLYLCCFFEELSRSIDDISHQLKASSSSDLRIQTRCSDGKNQSRCRLLTVEIYRMVEVHHKLMMLSRRFTAFYQWQLMFLLFSVVSANVICSFYFLVYLTGPKTQQNDQHEMFIFLQIVIVNLISFWLNICVCERNVNAARDVSRRLQVFTEFQHLDLRLARCIEHMSLQCSSEQYRLSICGLFDLSHRTAHQTLVTTFMYLIVLVQYGYENFSS